VKVVRVRKSKQGKIVIETIWDHSNSLLFVISVLALLLKDTQKNPLNDDLLTLFVAYVLMGLKSD